MTPPTSSSVPTIVLDDAHNQTAGDSAEEYSIPESGSLIVDVGTYTIPVPEKLGVDGPNAVHLIHGSDEYYRLPWDGRGTVTLEAGTLKVVKGSGPFRGFQSGEKYVIGVGYDKISGIKRKLSFAVMWVGMVNVE